MQCLRQLLAPDDGSPDMPRLSADLGHFGALAAAAAVRAGVSFETTVRVRESAVMLPTLGLARVEAPDGWARARGSGGTGRVEIVRGGAAATVTAITPAAAERPPEPGGPGDPAEADARWLPLRRLRSTVNDQRIPLGARRHVFVQGVRRPAAGGSGASRCGRRLAGPPERGLGGAGRARPRPGRRDRGERALPGALEGGSRALEGQRDLCRLVRRLRPHRSRGRAQPRRDARPRVPAHEAARPDRCRRAVRAGRGGALCPVATRSAASQRSPPRGHTRIWA